MKEVKFSAQALLRSRVLAGYQRDFARAVLGDEEYTVEEAVARLDASMGAAMTCHGPTRGGVDSADMANEKEKKRKDVK